MALPGTNPFIGNYNTTAGIGGVFLSAFSDGRGRMSVTRLTFQPPPKPGPKRRAVRP